MATLSWLSGRSPFGTRVFQHSSILQEPCCRTFKHIFRTQCYERNLTNFNLPEAAILESKSLLVFELIKDSEQLCWILQLTRPIHSGDSDCSQQDRWTWKVISLLACSPWLISPECPLSSSKSSCSGKEELAKLWVVSSGLLLAQSLNGVFEGKTSCFNLAVPYWLIFPIDT